MVDEAEQMPRFGALRQVPPEPVIGMLTGAASGGRWTASRLGVEGGFPNGGLWRVEAEQRGSTGPASVVVKRTGPAYLGTSKVWRCRAEPTDPQWWGREAEFYASELARSGWPAGVRPAWCHVDDHEEVRDLWLEELADIPASLELCQRAVAGLARWQVANAGADHGWLSDGWIARHISRQELDNERTLAHPEWPAVIERGLDPYLRECVASRVTDPAEVHRLLAGFPQTLTHHDFHNCNIGTVDEDVVLIDWAYVGQGPIGHDAGHLALTLDLPNPVDPAEAWRALESAYCDGLVAAGWDGDLAGVRRSMAVSNRLRFGWLIDYVLDNADQAPDALLAASSRLLLFLAGLR